MTRSNTSPIAARGRWPARRACRWRTRRPPAGSSAGTSSPPPRAASPPFSSSIATWAGRDGRARHRRALPDPRPGRPPQGARVARVRGRGAGRAPRSLPRSGRAPVPARRRRQTDGLGVPEDHFSLPEADPPAQRTFALLIALPRVDHASPRSEQVATVRDLLSRLPDRLAEVAVYYYVDEMTHAEIAGILGCSRRHVGDILQRLQQWSEDDALSYAK